MCYCFHIFKIEVDPDNKVRGANMGPPGSCRPQVGPMLAPWTLLSGIRSDRIKMVWGVVPGHVQVEAQHHDDVIKWKHFPRNWPFVREIRRSPVNFPHKGQWRGALMFSLIYAWINDWVNNREAGDLRRQHGHYDVIVMPNVEGLPDLADLPVLVIPDVDKTALWLGDCGVFVGQVHTHPITMNWWMAGGTCHPINKPYEITAALLERSCATASSPVYLNWSAPHMSSHTSWKNQVINFELSYLGIPSMNPLSRWSTFWKYCYLVAT